MAAASPRNRAGRASARPPRPPVVAHHGLRYGALSDAANPRAPVLAAEGRLSARDLTDVPVFPQLPSRLERVMGPGIRDNPQAADAFFLNVWAPEGAAGLPVLVFLHGGAWVSGGGAARWYRGQRLAAEGLVVVTLNYRLGPAGHLADRGAGAGAEPHRPAGDIMTALRWVRDHIHAFGGDAGQVTLAGQSAGAWYAWALAGHGPARGLFRRLAMLSAPGITPWSLAERATFTAEVEARAARLRPDAPGETEALLEAGAAVLAGRPLAEGAIPNMYLPLWPAAQSDAATHLHVEALYLRTTGHEMSVFLPPDATTGAALRARTGDAPAPTALRGATPAFAEAVARASQEVFGRFNDHIADAARARDQRVIRRRFMAESGLPGLGACHCFDLPFQFGNPEDWHDAPMLSGWTPAAFAALSEATVADLAAFVRGEEQAGEATLGATPAEGEAE